MSDGRGRFDKDGAKVTSPRAVNSSGETNGSNGGAVNTITTTKGLTIHKLIGAFLNFLCKGLIN